MAKFTILVQVSDAKSTTLPGLVANLESQSFTDWQLILVTNKLNLEAQQVVNDLAATRPRVDLVIAPAGDILAWVTNSVLPTLGDWVGFMAQRDRLKSNALQLISNTIDSLPAAKVVYTDEESRNQAGVISLRMVKGAINPIRLRTQEYLRGMTVVNRAWLQTLGGYDRMAIDTPSHDLYLRTLDLAGPEAFANVPTSLFQRFRNHAERVVMKDRRDILNGFDTYGITKHLERRGLPGTIRRRVGSVEIVYKPDRKPWVTLFVVNDGSDLIQEALDTAAEYFGYRPLNVVAIPAGPDLLSRLNLAIPAADTEKVCILQGLPVNPDWLFELVTHAVMPGVGAVGSRLINTVQLTQPGLLNYRFEGWDWNTRGRFNELVAPHQVSALSLHSLLLDSEAFANAGGFDTSLGDLAAMDLCLRMDAAGKTIIQVPRSIVQVATTEPPPEEAAAFWAKWPGWTCRFGLHPAG